MVDYREFLKSKQVSAETVGRNVALSEINPMLFDWQAAVVRWAVQRGRAALFEDCGLGKTFQQLEWARLVLEPGQAALILTPLAVAHQTKGEADKLGVKARVVSDQAECGPGINITNYHKLHHFEPSTFSALVLDESSILKSFDGKTRKQITDFARSIKYRLACSATPAPNDLIELTNHSEFLDIMRGKEIIALFFTQDGNTTHKWRLKRHAEADFWRWLASWSVAVRMPEDLGFGNGDFVLPPLRMHEVKVPCSANPRGTLFEMGNLTLQERRAARRLSLENRVAACAEAVNASDEPWLVWCDLNAESMALARAIPDAVEVKGSDPVDHKEDALHGFSSGKYRVLITKPTIAGFGMNWQHCCKMSFVGLSDSYEQVYQATRRCWRFGQKNPVDAHIIISDAEGTVKRNIERKEAQAAEMFENIVQHTKGLSLGRAERNVMDYENDKWSGEGWELWLGDSVELIRQVETESVGLTVFSPPFPSMYAYTNSERDMGNCKDIGEMIGHYAFLAPELLRITMPGRSCCVHLTQAVAFKGTDGYIGIKDFRGRTIETMEAAGWIYYGEVCIDKNPQLKAIRTKDAGLLFKSLATDSARLHMALADYVLQFRKPGENTEPIKAAKGGRYKGEGWITAEEWIEWAAPVWYRADRGVPGGISETDVLNVRMAREEQDERHLCPLQLGVIERCVKLWSNPGDLVFSPFGGIGSEGYEAIRLGRRALLIELKRSYAEAAARNLARAERLGTQGTLFEAVAK